MTVGEFWRSMKNALGKFKKGQSTKRRSKDGRRNALFAEQLEQRQLLSVNQILFDAASSSIVVSGTPDADKVTLWMDSPTIVHVKAESVGGVVESTFLRSSVSSIRFDGGNGNDRFENVTSLRAFVQGGNGDDFLRGGTANDELDGGAGNDQLFGGEGNDLLLGGDGDDAIYGEVGDDAIDGGSGNDLLVGALGNDTIIGGIGNDTLSGDDGQDQLYGNEGLDQLKGGSGDDWLFGGDDRDILFGGDGNDQLWGEGGDDAIYGEAGDDVLNGGAGNDFLVSGIGNDILNGGDGDDKLYGEAGRDQLYGSDGNDELYGGADDDRLYGGNGRDVLFGSDGNDLLRGEDGDDTIYGEAGNDELDGGAGSDLLMGGIGDDILNGSYGDDKLRGDAGQDVLYGSDGDDELIGGDDNDRLFGGSGRDVLFGSDGNDLLRGEDDDDVLYGEAGDDELDGGAGTDVLFAGIGNDILNGSYGDDKLYGEAGQDVLYGSDGNDELVGGADNDRLYGGAGRDVLFGGDGNDQLRGEDDDDTLYGEAGNDVLEGGAGSDVLFGGIGTDVLNGGYGDDKLNGEAGQDWLFGSDGNDELVGGADDDWLFGGTGRDVLFGGDGHDQLRGEEDDDALYGEAGNDVLDGGGGNDLLVGSVGNDRLDGGAGKDRLAGGDGSDTLYGGDGDDDMYGDEGDDWLYGQGGDDSMFGGTGTDVMFGDAGNDVMYGEAGNDVMFGGDGQDQLRAGAGNDTLYGNGGDDYLIGNEGSDVVDGGDGNDEIVGSDETDYLFGGAGDDVLWALSGQHVFSGGDGDDRLTGLNGNDVLIGGSGRDELNGLGGDDLLIGGSTAYDSNSVQLGALFAAWAGPLAYASRVAQITSDSFGARLASNVTVFDDEVADAIFGGEGQDWFFLTGVLSVYDPNMIDGDEHAQEEPIDDGHGHSHPEPLFVSTPPALEGFAFIDSLDKLNDRQSNESIQSLIPHAQDPVLQREHLALNQLVRYADVTHYATQNGAWSNPATWSNGVVPSNGARVLIPTGVQVVVDRVISARLATIRVDGTLSFSTTASSELRVDTIVVTNIGRFEMGTEATPIPQNVTAKLLFTNNGPIDRVADPFGISRGLISHGAVSMYGAPVTSYAASAGAVTAGSSIIFLKSIPAGWKTGDTIVVASTVPGAAQNEVRKIAAIFANRVFLERPLAYSHVPISANYEFHVANVTRNVSIASESSAIDRRGHTMFMHSRNVHISNVGFYQLGRTDKSVPLNDPVVDANWQLKPGTGTNPRARYSVHFHRNGFINDGNPATISGSAVVDSPGWGFVNHSSYVDMRDNVAFDVNGAAFATEVGDEIGSFVNNIAIGTTGSGESTESRLSLQDFGHEGDGFWLQGPGVTFTGNVSAGNEGSAFVLFAQGLIEGGIRKRFLSANLPDPTIAKGAVDVSVESVPMLQFENNVGYASSGGLSVWYHLRSALNNQQGFFSNSRFWSNTIGVETLYTRRTVLRNLVIERVPNTAIEPETDIGVRSTIAATDVVYDNLTVTGYYRGIVFPRFGTSTVIGGKYNNYQDFMIQPAVIAGRRVYFTGAIQMNRMLLDPFYYSPPLGIPATFPFLDDQIWLDFGPFDNQRAYYATQDPDAIPFPKPVAGLPASYVGLTSQQLWNLYRVAVGGQLAPAETITVPSIVGLIGPAS